MEGVICYAVSSNEHHDYNTLAKNVAAIVGISVEEAIRAIERIVDISMTTQEVIAQLQSFYDDMMGDPDDYISELRAESMEPHPVIVIFPAVEALRCRTLRDLYGQGVDTGPLASRPGLTRPADDWPMEGRNGNTDKRRIKP